jgi:hypothetical protein|tara:strand:+ start:190 stop:492 length:303 start_codon:yes stop_codon:yes gene_type:complete
MHTLNDFINSDWLDEEALSEKYINAKPFPHIVMKNFIKKDLLNRVLEEFPDLSKNKLNTIQFNDEKQIKFASKEMDQLSPSAFHLCSFLNSSIFLGLSAY